MWIAHTDGWLSIVAHRDDPHILLVRAREEFHITHLWMDAIIEILPDADYMYRAYIPREFVAEKISEQIMCMDYPNFKNQVSDSKLKTVFLSIHHFIQEYYARG